MNEANRARSLGDVEESAPTHWQWGGSERTLPDVLLLLYALPGQLDAWQAAISDALFAEAFLLLQQLDTSADVTHEPFGFADGISQPAIDWHREQTTDNHRRDAYSNLLALGEVVLGYPNEYGEYTARPLVAVNSPGAAMLPAAEEQPGLADFGRNGSYLVLRQLEQDVGGFWRFIDEAAGHDAQRREELAAAMVGRKRDGSPLVPHKPERIPGIDPAHEKNQFAFDDDPHGVACPIASHVRRSNPRTGDFPHGVQGLFARLRNILGFDANKRDLDLVASTRFHRILRRGRPYGPPGGTVEETLRDEGTSGTRGLHFICLAANIRRQFEFVQSAWSVSGKFGGLQDEEDCVTGSRLPLFGGTPCNQFSRPQVSGVRQCLAGIPRFVTVRGGAYFFMPGLRALQFLAAESADGAARKEHAA